MDMQVHVPRKLIDLHFITVPPHHPHLFPAVRPLPVGPSADRGAPVHGDGTSHDPHRDSSLSGLCQVDKQAQVLEQLLW